MCRPERSLREGKCGWLYRGLCCLLVLLTGGLGLGMLRIRLVRYGCRIMSASREAAEGHGGGRRPGPKKNKKKKQKRRNMRRRRCSTETGAVRRPSTVKAFVCDSRSTRRAPLGGRQSSVTFDCDYVPGRRTSLDGLRHSGTFDCDYASGRRFAVRRFFDSRGAPIRPGVRREDRNCLTLNFTRGYRTRLAGCSKRSDKVS